MRLATFNLESFGDDRFQPERLAPRLAALRPRLNELRADVLCLQEVNGQKPPRETIRTFAALEHLLEGTPYGGYHRAFCSKPGQRAPGDRHNLLVLSRYPVMEVQCLHHARVSPPLWQPAAGAEGGDVPEPVLFDRPILKVRLDVGGARPLHVFTVHLRAPIAVPLPGAKLSAGSWKTSEAWAEGYFIASMKRTAQALDLRLAVDALLDQDPDVLIAVSGDFNATGDASALRLLRAETEDTGNPALAGRQLVQLDAMLPPAERQTVLHNGRGQALDHILASQALRQRFRTIQVFNRDLPDEVIQSGTAAADGSFHAAVCAEFDL
ncbi:endonuclease/exonuclease/phosphatase family protein [Roseibium litorale]|uniref:Endonuclease/exonuclease/phosphatase family protein n=1 Tax=Roseibium litorale TaxID=2803841 RepID=A0ABR9CML8_9HYPH|nr:endonuclease/exonuclease/phosphatase family protein [Roseibium litorale]MBD8892082.1 endonuclease/exonuclease/phosphatase family protein [Roseibium litorale]